MKKLLILIPEQREKLLEQKACCDRKHLEHVYMTETLCHMKTGMPAYWMLLDHRTASTVHLQTKRKHNFIARGLLRSHSSLSYGCEM
jgi:hypothetical protein